MKVNVLHGVPAENQTMFTLSELGGAEDADDISFGVDQPLCGCCDVSLS